MAHMIKLKGADKVRIMKEATRELSFYKNDVDRSRSSNNYDLQGRADPIAYMNERLAQCVNHKRKNVVEVCNWIVTLPKDVPRDEHEKFFRSVNEFLENRYGKDNVVMSAVHMDETTPHMHAFILPVQETEKGLKLNARDVVGRQDLQHFHEDLNKKVDRDLGYHCSVQTGETIENKSLSKFKLDKMREELHQMQEEVSKIEGVKNLNERHQKALEAYYDLLDKYEALESQISDLGISLTDDYLER